MTQDAPAAGVEARGVRRGFGSVEALRGVDLTAPYGEVTALVGPNGSGKTTLFLVLATLLVPDGGEVRVAGYDPVRQPIAARSHIGWMPDMFGMYDQLTAREYLTFFARSYRLPGDAIPARVEELLARVHLSPYADQQVHVLSRGQKQRLGVARALVHQPSVLLLDEPASGLDPRSRIDLRDLLRTLTREGVAVLVSSHILSELDEIADSVVIVDHGVTMGAHRIDTGVSQDVATEQAGGQADQGRRGWQGRQAWRIRALDTPSLIAALDERDVEHTAPSSAGVEVAPHSEREIATLLAELVSAGVPVVAVAPTVSEIEAAYLELTEERR